MQSAILTPEAKWALAVQPGEGDPGGGTAGGGKKPAKKSSKKKK